MRALSRPVCPECGREFAWRDVKGRSPRLTWRVAAVDLAGLIGTAVVNGLVVIALAIAVLVFNKGSWFTAARFKLGRGGPESISALLLIAIALSLVAWGWAWGRTGESSWRLQNALAVWCWILTGLHIAGLITVIV